MKSPPGKPSRTCHNFLMVSTLLLAATLMSVTTFAQTVGPPPDPGISAQTESQPNWYEPSLEAQLMFIFESRGFQLLLKIIAACVLLSLIPAAWPYAGRLSWGARFALLGAAATGVAGQLMGMIISGVPVGGPVHSISFVVILVDAILATGGYLLSRRPHLRHLRSSFLAVFGVCLLRLAIGAANLPGATSSSGGLALQSGLASILAGILAGFAFGLFYRPARIQQPHR